MANVDDTMYGTRFDDLYSAPPPLKPAGWCVAEGIAHHWWEPPAGQIVILGKPERMPRICVNCGHKMVFVPGHWKDA